MNILNYLRPTKVYTAAQVHAEITAKVLLLMEQMKQQVEAVELPAEMRSELDLLRSVGLTNSANMEALKGAEQRVNDINASRQLTADRIRLVQLMHKHYGPDVMLMRTEDFMALLDKYNLVCGVLEDYTGSVPKKNLEEIVRAKDFCDKVKSVTPHYTEMHRVYGYKYYSDIWDKRIKENPSRQQEKDELTFIGENLILYNVILECTKEFKKEAPYNIDRFPLMNTENTFGIISIDHDRGRLVHRLLIAAPAQEMKNRPKIVERIRTEDPFVFSVTDCGVLIYSAWGDDELVQKYRRLNEWLASCDAMKSLNV